MSNVIDTVEITIQSNSMTTLINLVTPRIELLLRKVNVSSRRDGACVMVSSNLRNNQGSLRTLRTQLEKNIFHDFSLSEETRE